MEYSNTVRLPFLNKRSPLSLRDGDREKPGYRYGWRLLAQVADTMGVDLSEQEIEHWRTTFGITRALDDMIDEEGCKDIEPALTLLLNGEPVGQVTEKEALDFQASMATHPEAEKEHLKEEMKKIAAFANDKTQATSLKELLRLTRTEMEWYTALFELKESGAENTNNRRQFNSWLYDFMSSGYMLDSLVDMEDDFRNGNISVEPSLRRKKVLAVVALKEVARSASKTPLRHLGGVAYIGYRYLRPVKS